MEKGVQGDRSTNKMKYKKGSKINRNKKYKDTRQKKNKKHDKLYRSTGIHEH
jgi:hypothetical protein